MQVRAVAIVENSARRFWVTVILLLMSVNLGIAVYAIVVAVGDKSIRPMPGGNAQAVGWQERLDLFRKSDELGWSYTLEPAADGVALKLLDRSGRPIVGCTGKIRAYHYTAAGRVKEAAIQPADEQDAGAGYFASIDLSQLGLWNVMLELDGAAGEHFVADQVWNRESKAILERASTER